MPDINVQDLIDDVCISYIHKEFSSDSELLETPNTIVGSDTLDTLFEIATLLSQTAVDASTIRVVLNSLLVVYFQGTQLYS